MTYRILIDTNGNSFSNKWAYILEGEFFKFNFLNFILQKVLVYQIFSLFPFVEIFKMLNGSVFKMNVFVTCVVFVF